MDKTLKMTIHKIKSIKHAVLELPIKNGVYAIVGNNGTGKSTIVYSFAQLISKGSLSSFGIDVCDGDSYVEFEYKGVINRWNVKADKFSPEKVFLTHPYNPIRINGMYEGSLFFGFRFKNYEKVKKLLSDGKIDSAVLSTADDYIVEQLGYILHGDSSHYKDYNLVRLKNKDIVEQMGLEETPYFMMMGDTLISQYGMSSGESLMLSLLHFIYNSIVRRSLDPKRPALMLIDEIEMALHPIAVSRLLDLLHELANKRNNLTVYITSHSPEVISKITPRNMYKIEPDNSNPDNTLNITNPCYPSYAIRDVYRHDGYDWLLLVEDALAKIIVENVISELQLSNSKLIHIAPVGGWNNVLNLQYDLYKHNVLGVGKKVISILDGDIKDECKKNALYDGMPKRFLPIASVEKYLKYVLLDNKNPVIFKRINDDLFQITPLSEVIASYKNGLSPKEKDNNGKIFYDSLLNALKERNIDEQQFVLHLAGVIKSEVDFSSFNESLKSLLSDS